MKDDDDITQLISLFGNISTGQFIIMNLKKQLRLNWSAVFK